MTKRVPVTTQNVSKIDYGRMCAFNFASSGAMGSPGHVGIFMDNNDSYDLYYLGSPELLDRFCEAFPTVHALLSFEPVNGWQSVYVGMGNMLFIRDAMFERMKHDGVDFSDPMNAFRYLHGDYMTMRKSKNELYQELINDARASYKQGTAGSFKWCDECKKAINLWTYWQGIGNLDPDILLVGRDWGNPSSPVGSTCMGHIEAINNCEPSNNIPPYLQKNGFPTDIRIERLFHDAFDIDVNEPNEKLFFTNFVLGYSPDSNSMKLKAKDLYHDLDFFKRLVNILQPKVIICLGQDVWKSVLKAYGLKRRFEKGFKTALDDGENHVDYEGMKIFVVAHPGNRGSCNRVKGNGDASREASLKAQIKDWKRIREALDQL